MSAKINFFNILIDQCNTMDEAMTKLHEFCSSNDNLEAGDLVIALEDKGDMSRRILIDELNKTYFTPIDREDLFALSRLIDEITDNAKTMVEGTRLFKVAPLEQMSRITATLVKMTGHILKALQKLEKYKSIAREEALTVKQFENFVSKQFHEALSELFELDDYKIIFKYRELYKHLKHISEIADQAMDFLLNIIVKM